MKRRLHQAALAAVMRAFAGQEPIAQQHAGALQHAAFFELVLMGDQHVADGVGMGQVIDALATQREIDDVAVLAGHFFEKRGRVFAELGEHADEHPGFWPWRVRQDGRRPHTATIIAGPAATAAATQAWTPALPNARNPTPDTGAIVVVFGTVGLAQLWLFVQQNKSVERGPCEYGVEQQRAVPQQQSLAENDR